MAKATMDIRGINFGRILIEVDSEYWHRNTILIDEKKNEIAIQNGFTIIRVNVDSCRDVKRVLAETKASFKKALQLSNIRNS